MPAERPTRGWPASGATARCAHTAYRNASHAAKPQLNNASSAASHSATATSTSGSSTRHSTRSSSRLNSNTEVMWPGFTQYEPPRHHQRTRHQPAPPAHRHVHQAVNRTRRDYSRGHGSLKREPIGERRPVHAWSGSHSRQDASLVSSRDGAAGAVRRRPADLRGFTGRPVAGTGRADAGRRPNEQHRRHPILRTCGLSSYFWIS
jgi:hypothetical protein